MEHSFMVLAYGESPYLEDCVKSLLAQRVKSRILLSTSTPNDHIKDIAARYDLPLIVNPERLGIAGDWNFALKNCPTQLCTLAHQDDLYYPGYTESLLPRMEGASLGFCDYEELLNGAPRPATAMMKIKRVLLTPARLFPSLNTRGLRRSVLRFGSAICCPSVMYNRAYLADFTFDGGYKVSLDWDAWLRIADLPGSFVFAPAVQMAHRIHEDSETTRQIAAAGRLREDREMFSRLWPDWIAGLLARLYNRSTDFNAVGEEKA